MPYDKMDTKLFIVGLLFIVIQTINGHPKKWWFDQNTDIQCVDEDNNPVDWVIFYKLPRIHQSLNPLVQNGEAYMYITSSNIQNFKNNRSANKQWILSKHSVTNPNSLPSKIISPVLFNNNKLGMSNSFAANGVKILYNDQTPHNGTTVKFGHSKGMVLGNDKGGVWIVHSVPHFTDDTQSTYNYPHTGLMYGQNFLCMSLNSTELDKVAMNLKYNQIYIYSKFISDSIKDQYKLLNEVIQGSKVDDQEHETNDVEGNQHKRLMKRNIDTNVFDYFKYTMDDNQQLENIELMANNNNGLNENDITFEYSYEDNTNEDIDQKHSNIEDIISKVGIENNEKQISNNNAVDKDLSVYNHLIKNSRVNDDNFYKGIIYTKFNSYQFITFAKKRELQDDLYKRVSLNLNLNLYVETWPNGPGRLHSNCKMSENKVENVQKINVNIDNVNVVYFNSTHDHSKWTINFMTSNKNDGENNMKTKSNVPSADYNLKGSDKTSENNINTNEIHFENKEKSGNAKKIRNVRSLENYERESFENMEDSQEKSVKVYNKDNGESNIINNLNSMDEINMVKEILDLNDDDVMTNNNANYRGTKITDSINKLIKEMNDTYNVNEHDKIDEYDVLDMNIDDPKRETSVEIDDFQRKYDNENLYYNTIDSAENVIDVDEHNGVNINEEKTQDNNVNDIDDGYHFVCNGDINRAEDQLKRGGGTVCINNKELWELYQSVIVSVEPCPI